MCFPFPTFIDDIFSLWNVDKEEIYSFIELANNHHPTIKFTAEVSETETAFLDTCIYKGERFKKESILDVRSHFKPTETFQYTYFSSCHPPGVKKGFIKNVRRDQNATNFKQRLRMRGYRDKVIDKHLSEVKHHERMSALENKTKMHKKGWRMVLQKLWVSQNFSRISRVSQHRFLSGYVRLAVSFFIRRCLGVSIFCTV